MAFTNKIISIRAALSLILITTLSGCAAAGAVSAVAQIASLAMNSTGLNKPIDPNATNNIPLKILASNALNSDNQKHPFSVVVRIYQLKQSSAFQQAFYDVFLDPQKEKDALAGDVIAVKEITLIPGQTYINTEKISVTADYVGVVALYQAPASGRWKLTFPTKDIKDKGLVLGLNDCSITVTAGNSLEYTDNKQSLIKTPAQCS
ncbi:type VI secretion system lipoprotein TssJ [Sulfuriferula nivalis]|uniref:Type VI secretion system-associated lipoprotein n=1 Tax=Sulfuriferula nivalis TaxID=2675298 RepID=A0A809RRZ9_9PROT|nr:type VI secretion system lipoprotein TssJ [Sulfuriferula nivalis]BBP01651.1 type VI secretion system-associated lipoprotein [Sulfuriferula nivalis]